MKSKRLLWILVMVILVVSSVIVEGAIWDRIRGMGNVGGVSLPVLITNIMIITLFLYVIFGVLGRKFNFFKADSNTGKVVLFIVLIGFAIVIAFRVGNLWIWQEDAAVRPAFRFLFDANGILRPSRILIFIGASALLSWLFTSKVKIGQGKNAVDIVIAVILAAAMTREGLTKGTLIAGGQIISTILLYLQFKREGEEGFSWSAAVWSAGLVIWISAIAFPGQGLGFLKGVTSKVGKFGYFRYLIYLIVFALIAMVAGHFYKKKKKKDEEKEKEKRWKEDIVAYPVAYLKRWLGKVRNPVVRWLYKKWDPKTTTPEDEIPFPFRDLRVEFMTLMNYMLRLEVYKAKKNYVTKTQQFLDNEIYGEKGLHQVVQVNRINNYLNMLKNGFGFILNNKGEFEPIIKDVINEKGEKEKLEAGFNSTEWFIYELINNLKREVEEFTFIQNRDRAQWIENQLNKRMHRIDKYLISVKKRWGCEKFDSDTGRFTAFAMRKGAYNLLEGRRILIRDQYRRHGRYDHFYRFAKDDAQIYNVALIDQGPNPKNSVMGKYPKFGAATAGGKVGKNEKFKYEVDTKGHFLDDLNEYIVEGKNKGYIRKVDPKDVVEYDFFNDAAKWLEAEWDFYVWDVRDGRYHPNSRSAKDYADLHALRSFNYGKVKPHSGPIERKNPAFDRQALLDPAFDYIGRKNVRGVREVDVSKANIKPCISTLGMKRYILSYLEAKMKVDERFRYNLSRYVYDTGSEKEEVDVFTRAPKTEAAEGKK